MKLITIILKKNVLYLFHFVKFISYAVCTMHFMKYFVSCFETINFIGFFCIGKLYKKVNKFKLLPNLISFPKIFFSQQKAQTGIDISPIALWFHKNIFLYNKWKLYKNYNKHKQMHDILTENFKKCISEWENDFNYFIINQM